MSTWDPTGSLDDTAAPDESTHADEQVRRRLMSDGAAWRERLPSTDALSERVRSLPARSAPHATTRSREDTAVIIQQPTSTPSGLDRPSVPPAPLPPPRAPWTGLRGVVAAVVALAVVAAFILALHSAPKTGVSVAEKPTATSAAPAATATPGSVQGTWSAVPGLTHLSGLPVIAPSDPSVVYLADSATLRRSDDAGATWRDLPSPAAFPAGSNVQWVDLFVSPSDTKTVFATVSVSKGNQAACSGVQDQHIGALARFSGFVPCNIQYVSRDGGQTWRRTKLVGMDGVVGTLNADAINAYHRYSRPPEPTPDGTLYDLAGFGPQAGSPRFSLVRSTDGGLTWQRADGDIVSKGLNLCDYAVSDADQTIYALVASSGCSWDVPPPIALWSSGDGGAHWQEQTLPRQGLEEGMVVSRGALYVALAVPSNQAHVGGGTLGPTNFAASSDGGRTWTSSPAQGLAASALGSGLALAGPGGGVFTTFNDPQAAAGQQPGTWLVLWSLGQPSWQSVTLQAPPMVNFAGLSLTTDKASGRVTLWVTSATYANQTTYYDVYRYTP